MVKHIELNKKYYRSFSDANKLIIEVDRSFDYSV